MASYSDDFNRANGEIGAGWIEDNGDIDIVSNIAVNQTVGSWNRARYASVLDDDDHFSEADVEAQTAGKITAGPFARQPDTSNQTHYLGGYSKEDNVSGYVIWKFNNSAQTELDTAASGNGLKTVRITVDGATQSMEVDTVEVCTDTDSDLTGGTYCGIGGYTTRGQFDNWSAEDLGAEGISIPVAMHHYTKNIASGR